MDLEERTIESLGDRCKVCGAKLTSEEQAEALERGGPELCSVHAAETLPAEELDDADLGGDAA
jgi:hypothetical protein